MHYAVVETVDGDNDPYDFPYVSDNYSKLSVKIPL